MNSARGLLDSDRGDDRMTEEMKRLRAQQLWRKAKSVLRAILTWKAI